MEINPPKQIEYVENYITSKTLNGMSYNRTDRLMVIWRVLSERPRAVFSSGKKQDAEDTF
jgi:hypothetical protein